jgi:hypothetical protein
MSVCGTPIRLAAPGPGVRVLPPSSARMVAIHGGDVQHLTIGNAEPGAQLSLQLPALSRDPQADPEAGTPSPPRAGPGARVLPPGYAFNLAMRRAPMRHRNSQAGQSAPQRDAQGAGPVGREPRTQPLREPRHDNASAHTSTRAACHAATPRRQGRPDRRRPLPIAIPCSGRSPRRDRRPRSRETGCPIGRAFRTADTARGRCRCHRHRVGSERSAPSPHRQRAEDPYPVTSSSRTEAASPSWATSALTRSVSIKRSTGF